MREIGTVFGRMLEDLGILDVAMLAVHDPQLLHEHLRGYNEAQRLARRSPTPAEVMDWIEQARSLHHLKLVNYETQGTGTASSVSVSTAIRWIAAWMFARRLYVMLHLEAAGVDRRSS